MRRRVQGDLFDFIHSTSLLIIENLCADLRLTSFLALLLQDKLQFQPASARSSEADAIHPQDRPRPSPDFEGDTNPQTGEIGGPKKEPLQWEKEWTYGGRATDF